MATKVVNGVRMEMTSEEVAALPKPKPRKPRPPKAIDALIALLKKKGVLNDADLKTL